MGRMQLSNGGWDGFRWIVRTGFLGGFGVTSEQDPKDDSKVQRWRKSFPEMGTWTSTQAHVSVFLALYSHHLPFNYQISWKVPDRKSHKYRQT